MESTLWCGISLAVGFPATGGTTVYVEASTGQFDQMRGHPPAALNAHPARAGR